MSALPQGYTMIDLSANDRAEIADINRWAFASRLTQAEHLAEPDIYDYDRTSGVRHADTGQLVAMHSSYRWENFPIPGAVAPVAGLTDVCVHPEHRRRGLLKAMIDLHFSRCAARGEVLSVLTASEPAIYGRFGYGRAADELGLSLSRGAALRPVAGTSDVTVRIVEASVDEHAQLVSELHRAAGTGGGLTRSGWATRDTPAVADIILFEQPHHRGGSENLRLMLAERAGKPVGYALFKRTDVWEGWDTGGGSKVAVQEYAALDGAAAHALWSRLLDLDLTTAVSAGPLATDDALLGMLVDIGAAKAQLSEMLWVRLIDVPRALAARRYTGDIDLILDVQDELLATNHGRWHLSASAFSDDVRVEKIAGDAGATGSEAAAEAAGKAAGAPAWDIRLNVRELGAAYLGGISLASLAAAGLVKAASAEPLLRCAAAFQWPLAPACTWHF